MADLLRPAALAALRRWREVGAGLALTGCALWLGLQAFGVLRWVAGAGALLGLALAWTGWQRLRFAREGGPGVVRLDERRLTYWGPHAGGVVDMDDLARLALDGRGPPTWLLTGPGGTLAIPADALGAPALLDAFAALPGLSLARVLAALEAPPPGLVTLWEAPAARLRGDLPPR